MTEPDRSSLAELYQENSKLRPTNSRQYGEFVSSITNFPYILQKMSGAYKSYPTRRQIALPRLFDEESPRENSIEDIISKRRTFRRFSGLPLTIEQTSKLLHFSYGITSSVSIPDLLVERQCFRAVPSAGALYPLEIYLVGWNIEGLDPGIYHYHVVNHALESLKQGDFCGIAGEGTISKDIADRAGALVLITGVFQRTMFKYNERGYRFVLLEAGHLAQNMCLMATAMNLAVMPIGGFLDDELNRMLGIDGVNESVVYPILTGRVD